MCSTCQRYQENQATGKTNKTKKGETKPKNYSKESCAVPTRKPTLFALLPALVYYFSVKYCHFTSVQLFPCQGSQTPLKIVKDTIKK